jgi:hypothetical protein
MSLVVSGIRAAKNSASFGKKTEMYLTRPRNACMSEANFRTGQFKILSTFDEFTLMPQLEMWWPRKSTSMQKKFQFLSIQLQPMFPQTIHHHSANWT